MKKQKQKAAGEKEKKPTTTSKDEAPIAIEDEPSTEAAHDEDTKPEEPATKDEGIEEPTAAAADVTTDSIPENAATSTSRPSGHARQPSLSIQSKLRSSSFRRTSTGPSGPTSPPTDLPHMTPDSSTITDIYRKQASRLEELERENKRLEKEAADGEARWRKSEEELEELREANGAATGLREKVKKGEEAQKEIEKLKAEISSIQRQHRGHSISKPFRSPSIGAESTVSPDPETKALLSSKDATITDMELEISNLRTQLSTQTSSCTTHGDQITALTTQLSAAESKVRDLTSELADTKRSLTRASEKAVKEGVERTSSDTKIRSLERELLDAQKLSDEVTKKAETLEKKLEAMNKLHRESESRIQAKLLTAEKEAREVVTLKKKMISLENENARLKDERERRKRKEANASAGGNDDDGLDELEDEERLRLEKRIRDLEGENFDLKRGVWKERRKELQEDDGEDVTSTAANGTSSFGAGEDFDEVDLSGAPTRPSNRHSRLLPTSPPQQQQRPPPQHSSFSTVLTSGLAAFRGVSPTQHHHHHQSLLSNDDDFLEEDGGDTFDEHAFARAQREEEARKMVEHVREVKGKLKNWEGWRLDLVEARRSLGAAGLYSGVGGGGGFGFGFGEIFEV